MNYHHMGLVENQIFNFFLWLVFQKLANGIQYYVGHLCLKEKHSKTEKKSLNNYKL